MPLTSTRLTELKRQAIHLRRLVVESVHHAGAGHDKSGGGGNVEGAGAVAAGAAGVHGRRGRNLDADGLFAHGARRGIGPQGGAVAGAE